VSIFDNMKIVVTNHAVYQFALRFHSDAPTNTKDLHTLKRQIKFEVREALRRRRMSAAKPDCLFPPDDPSCLYAWTEAQLRIYALRHDEDPPQFVVTTVMKPDR
jgi:hypothetical protein